ncbi:MAG: hypothetical protein ACREM3_15190 [Candidatus Rokuibacteriota bacterium]
MAQEPFLINPDELDDDGDTLEDYEELLDEIHAAPDIRTARALIDEFWDDDDEDLDDDEEDE